MNSNFTKVETMAQGPVSEFAAGELFATSAAIENSLTAGTVVQTGSGTTSTVVGFAPTEFATSAAAGIYNLNTSPGLPQATSASSPTLLVLPPSCSISRVYVTNNGTTLVGGTSYTIGSYSQASGLQLAGTVVPVTAMLLATANAGGVVGGQLFAVAATTALGFAGVSVATLENPVQVQPAVPSLVSVTTNGTANTAGDLAVYITYTHA